MPPIPVPKKPPTIKPSVAARQAKVALEAVLSSIQGNPLAEHQGKMESCFTDALQELEKVATGQAPHLWANTFKKLGIAATEYDEWKKLTGEQCQAPKVSAIIKSLEAHALIRPTKQQQKAATELGARTTNVADAIFCLPDVLPGRSYGPGGRSQNDDCDEACVKVNGLSFAVGYIIRGENAVSVPAAVVTSAREGIATALRLCESPGADDYKLQNKKEVLTQRAGAFEAALAEAEKAGLFEEAGRSLAQAEVAHR